MFHKLLERMVRISEMKDEPIITITKILDDDSGIWAGDEFEFELHELYDEYKSDPELAKRLAEELRKVADMVERQANEES